MLILVCVQDVPIGPVVFAGHRQNDPDEVEVEQEEHELAVVRQPIQEVIIVSYHLSIHKTSTGTGTGIDSPSKR